MATEDIRPKKKLGENIFGTSVQKAEGSKTVRPGDPNTTGAKVVLPSMTAAQQWQADWMRRLTKQAEKHESMLSKGAAEVIKKGWRSGKEQEVLTKYLGKSGMT